MANPIETLDQCSARLSQVQDTLTKTRKVATVLAGVAVAGGASVLLWKLFHDEPEVPTDGEDKE